MESMTESKKGEYYADYDEESDSWGVFHTDGVGDFDSGHCFALHSSESEAEADAKERNKKLEEDAEKDDSKKSGSKKEKQDKDEDLTRASIFGTAEEQDVLAYVRKHYPEAPSTQAAFVKFVINSLKHSKEDSQKNQKHIEELEKKVEQLANMIDQTSSFPSDDSSEF